MVDPWSAGNYGDDAEQRHRLVRALTWVRNAPTDNGYAHPGDNLQGLVDLNKMKILRIDDSGVIHVPLQAAGNYTPDSIKGSSTDLQPLEITQADGPSFTVHGNDVTWQKWHFRVGFTRARGWCSTPSATKIRGGHARSSIGPRWWIWWCPMATPTRTTTAKTPLMLANMASACWPTRSHSAVTVWGTSTTSAPR